MRDHTSPSAGRPHAPQNLSRWLRRVVKTLLPCLASLLFLSAWNPYDDDGDRDARPSRRDRRAHDREHAWSAVPSTRTAMRCLAGSGDRVTRQRAAWWLGEHESRRSVAALVEALEDRDSGVRLVAAWALGEIKDPDAIDALIDVLERDDDPFVREMAALALGEIEDRSALRALRRAGDRDADLREPVAWAVREINDRANDEVWAGGQWHVDDLEVLGEEIRCVTSERLSQIPDLAGLREELTSTDATARRQSALGLGVLGQARMLDTLEDVELAVDALILTLCDPVPEVRAQAIWSLDEINPSRRNDR